jgi:hypothetical protein
MKKILLISTVLLCFFNGGFAQNTNNQSVKSDTTPSVKEQLAKGKGQDSTLSKKQISVDSFPVPKKAALWSLLPGGGQIYNKKWMLIKLPIVYGALGTTIYLITFNQKQYRDYKTADYNYRNSPDPQNPQTGIPRINPKFTNAARLREVRDAYFKRTQQMYILTGVTYMLAAAEAFTSAHLAHFDVSDDLSFRVKPSFEPVFASGNAMGLGIQLKF